MEYYGETITGEVRGYSWNPRTGYQQIVVYTGTPAQIEAAASTAISNGYSVRYVPDSNGTYSTLEVTYGAAETQDPAVPLSDEWSLVGNDLEKSIFEHPRITSVQESNGWTAQQKADFKVVVEAGIRGDGLNYTSTVEELIAAHSEAQDLIYYVYNELARGVEAFSLSQFVLRHTQIITSNSSIKPALDNVGKIYKTGDVQELTDPVTGTAASVPLLTRDETIPDTLKFSLPDGYWLKRTPSVEQYGTDKWQVTQEYWHADTYSTFLYEPAT